MTTQNKLNQDIIDDHQHLLMISDAAFPTYPYPPPHATFDPIPNNYRMIPDLQQYYAAYAAYHHQMMMAYYAGHQHPMQQTWPSPCFGQLTNDDPQRQFVNATSQQQLTHSNSLVETDEKEVTKWTAERRRRYPIPPAIKQKLAVVETGDDDSNQFFPPSSRIFTTNTNSSFGKRHEAVHPNSPDVDDFTTKSSCAAAPKFGSFRTKICRYFAKGRCDNGTKCNFLHQSIHPKCGGQEGQMKGLLGNSQNLEEMSPHMYTK